MAKIADKELQRSPYLTALRTKDESFFPKIHKADSSSRGKFATRSLPKKTYAESIFRPAEDKPVPRAPDLDEQAILASKEYQLLSGQLSQMQAQFQQQMAQIQQRKTRVEAKIKQKQQDSYASKYTLWELKNEILELETLLRQEQGQNQQLLDELGFRQPAPSPHTNIN